MEVLHRGVAGDHHWLVGTKLEREWLRTDRIAGGRRSTWSGAPFATVEWRLAPGLQVHSGLRLTAAEFWGMNVAPRLGITGRLPSGLYGKLAGARGFRAPSAKELFFEFVNVGRGLAYAIRGNQDLVPETSWNATAEVGVVRSQGRLHVRAFGNLLSDFIETTPQGDSAGIRVFTYQNVGEARTAGMDIGAEYLLGPALVSASWTLLHTEDRATAAPLLGRAPQQARAALTIETGPVRWNPEVAYSGRTPIRRNRDGTTDYQDSFTRVNLSVGVHPHRAVDGTVGVDNLFDVQPAGAVLDLRRRWFARLSVGIGR